MNPLAAFVHRATRLAASATALAAAALLVSGCGGSTAQVQSFVPARLFGIGDEVMLLVDDGTHDGFKYTINDRSSAGPDKCMANPTFLQAAANARGMVFAECNPNGLTVNAFTLAADGAKVADLVNQIGSVPGGLSRGDMVISYVGSNDVVELWQQVASGQLTLDQAQEEARQRGKLAASVLNGILATGARLIVVTVPNQGLSPWGAAQEAYSPGAAGAIRSINYEYNAEMRVGIDAQRYDGRHYGLVPADDTVTAMYNFPTLHLAAPYDTLNPACDPTLVTGSLLSCTTTTLVPGAIANSNLWADSRHFGPAAHSRIGLQVQQRVLLNPF